jgi:predicted amidohydrolase
MRIATAQNRILGDPKANGREIRELMCMALDAGAELIHFPEGAISGYVKSPIRSWEEVNWELLRKELEKTATLAGNLGLWVVLGSNHRLSQPNRPHTACTFSRPMVNFILAMTSSCVLIQRSMIGTLLVAKT